MFRFLRKSSSVMALLLASSLALAGEPVNELFISGGTGRQLDSDQHNSQFAIDYNFHHFQRSARSGFTLGMGYTRLRTDAAINTTINAYSLYPQLTLWPVSQRLPGAYFFVRALGPTYLDENRLGDRQQANHFAFQSQVGVGLRRPLYGNSKMMLQVSWKHFSNANLFDENDGIDVPFVFAFGVSW